MSQSINLQEYMLQGIVLGCFLEATKQSTVVYSSRYWPTKQSQCAENSETDDPDTPPTALPQKYHSVPCFFASSHSRTEFLLCQLE